MTGLFSCLFVVKKLFCLNHFAKVEYFYPVQLIIKIIYIFQFLLIFFVSFSGIVQAAEIKPKQGATFKNIWVVTGGIPLPVVFIVIIILSSLSSSNKLFFDNFFKK